MKDKNKPDSPRWWGCEMSKCKYCEIAKSEYVGVRVFEDLPIDWDNSNGGSATMMIEVCICQDKMTGDYSITIDNWRVTGPKGDKFILARWMVDERTLLNAIGTNP